MREVIIGILNVEEMNSRTKFSETENVYKAEFPSMYQNMGELIRCKDCKYWRKDAEPYSISICNRSELCMGENDYCSLAERKEK